MKDPIIGIDLGTSNSVAAVVSDGGPPIVLADRRGFKIQPSVVSFHPNGSVLVGADAKQRRVIDPANTVYSAKRLIGRTFGSREVTTAASRMPYAIKEGINQQPVVATRAGELAIPEIAAIVLDHMRSLARDALATEVGRAVITVPANFGDAQRSATATAGAIAGITVVRVINEPTAAALAYGHGRRARETIAVYDFGGGTFDVTLLRLDGDVYEVLSTAGDSFLGGDDLDERLVELFAQTFLERHRVDLSVNPMAMQRLRAVAEQVKIELSRRARTTVHIAELSYGPGGAPLDLDLELSRDAFLARIGELVNATFPVCRNALELAGLGPEGVDEVILVGGTTKMPYVRERVAGFFGRAPRTDVNPDEAVALGAAIQGEAMRQVLGPAARTTARAASVAPPAPPMESRPRSPGVPPPPPADAIARRLAPSPRHTTRRAAVTADRAAQPPPIDKLIASADDGATPSRATKRTEAAHPHPRRMTAPQPFESERAPAVRPAASGAEPAREPGEGRASPVAPTLDDFNVNTEVPTAIRRALAAGQPPDDDQDFEGAATGVKARPSGRVTPGADADFEAEVTGVDRRLPAAAPKPAAAVGADPGAPTRATAAPAAASPAGAGATPAAAPAPVPPVPREPATADPGVSATALGAVATGPTVLEVVPEALAIATVAGYCDEIIHRNSQLPCQRSRVFAPSHDFQDTVRIRICLGDSRRFDDNEVLGEVALTDLPPRRRADTRIAVSFEIDASGILRVAARDEASGDEQKVTLTLVGAQTDEQIEDAKRRFRALRGDDR